MRIEITIENFPMDAIDMLQSDLESQGIKGTIQPGMKDLVVTANVEDCVKGQIFTILVDKYKFWEGGDPNEKERQTAESS